MKQLFAFLVACFVSIVAWSQMQGNAQVFAYRQEVLPGMVRADINGNEAPREPQYNYYIYLVSSVIVSPVEVWMKGKIYKVNTKQVSAPVEYKNPTSAEKESKTLVPKTSKKIFQLNISSEAVDIPNAKEKILSSKNELVIIYKSGNKLCYKTISKFCELEPLAMQ